MRAPAQVILQDLPALEFSEKNFMDKAGSWLGASMLA